MALVGTGVTVGMTVGTGVGIVVAVGMAVSTGSAELRSTVGVSVGVGVASDSPPHPEIKNIRSTNPGKNFISSSLLYAILLMLMRTPSVSTARTLIYRKGESVAHEPFV